MILSYIIQIILAIVLLLMLLFIAYMVWNYESLLNIKNAMSVKKEIVIFDGIMDFATTQWSFNTYNSSLASFKDLTPSVNQNGGAEYSYNFWLYMNKTGLNNISSSDVVLLMRGSKMKVPYINSTNCEVANKDSYIFVKNPLIRMKSDGTAMIVEYNTITNPDSYRENGANIINCSSGSWYDKNKGLLGIYNMDNYVYNKKWFMVTVVLQEIMPENDILYKNKTSCKIYLNGINVLDRVVESPYANKFGSAAMKHNRAPLHVNPGNIFSTTGNSDANPFVTSGTGTSALQMANLHYFNYALTEADIMTLFSNKFKQSAASAPMDDGTGEEDKYAIAALSEQSNNLPLPF